MEELVRNIASAGDLSSSTADMRLLLYMFLFTFVISIFVTIILTLKGLGK